mmetsp:Transcript_37728/g.89605  ORF Transcript_37728/g.89605 Transcript_37728/m.89605 type:complete len:285 (-) Transcript_37728:233-1087(-)
MSKYQKVLGLSAKEIQEIKAVNKNWHISAEDDGWTMAHRGLTSHMQLLLSALRSCSTAFTDSKAVLSTTTVTVLWEAFELFHANLNHHHSNEDELVFPFMKQKCSLPERVSSEHKQIIHLIDEVKTNLSELKALKNPSVATQEPLVGKACDAMASLLSVSMEHFEEEEETALVLLRKNFTEEEYGPVFQKIMQSETMDDLAYLLSGAYPAEKDRIKWCKMIAQMPSKVIRKTLKPAVRKLEAEIINPLHDIAAGEEPVVSKKKNPVFECFSDVLETAAEFFLMW